MALLTTKRIAVLRGGQSAEREVSMRSGQAVWAALVKKGYDAIPVDTDSSVAARLREVRAQIARELLVRTQPEARVGDHREGARVGHRAQLSSANL